MDARAWANLTESDRQWLEREEPARAARMRAAAEELKFKPVGDGKAFSDFVEQAAKRADRERERFDRALEGLMGEERARRKALAEGRRPLW